LCGPLSMHKRALYEYRGERVEVVAGVRVERRSGRSRSAADERRGERQRYDHYHQTERIIRLLPGPARDA